MESKDSPCAPVIALQLGRFVGSDPELRRLETSVSFEESCVLEGLDGELLVYEPKAVVMHLGASPLSGHYRTLLLPSGAVPAKPSDLTQVRCFSYLVLLTLQG